MLQINCKSTPLTFNGFTTSLPSFLHCSLHVSLSHVFINYIYTIYWWFSDCRIHEFCTVKYTDVKKTTTEQYNKVWIIMMTAARQTKSV